MLEKRIFAGGGDLETNSRSCRIFLPLVFSGALYFSNGENFIPYMDALFLCYSTITCTGLATLDLSLLTGFQQALIFVLQLLGNIVGES